MADDASDSDSGVSKMTGESLGQTSAVDILQTKSLEKVYSGTYNTCNCGSCTAQDTGFQGNCT